MYVEDFEEHFLTIFKTWNHHIPLAMLAPNGIFQKITYHTTLPSMSCSLHDLYLLFWLTKQQQSLIFLCQSYHACLIDVTFGYRKIVVPLPYCFSEWYARWVYTIIRDATTRVTWWSSFLTRHKVCFETKIRILWFLNHLYHGWNWLSLFQTKASGKRYYLPKVSHTHIQTYARTDKGCRYTLFCNVSHTEQSTDVEILDDSVSRNCLIFTRYGFCFTFSFPHPFVGTKWVSLWKHGCHYLRGKIANGDKPRAGGTAFWEGLLKWAVRIASSMFLGVNWEHGRGKQKGEKHRWN